MSAKLADESYALTSEVIREALHDWMQHQDSEQREMGALHEAVWVGQNSGPGSPAEEVYA